MKYKFVLLGPDDESGGDHFAQEDAAGVPEQGRFPVRYERKEPGIVRVHQLANGRLKSSAVANFSARILRDLIVDDGAEQGRHFVLEAELGERRMNFTLSAAEFFRMGWVLPKLGPQAIIYPGQQQHARAAIQWLSGDIPRESIFTHVGWRKLEEHWVYFHAGGALGTGGIVPDVSIQVPAVLEHYRVRLPEDKAGVARAVRASLSCLELAPDRITFPLLAAVYRAPFGSVDFSVFLTGRTGVFKTALAATCQQHFGSALDAHGLPGNFASTPAAVEELAYYAKDALLVVDDFVPTGNGDRERHAVAERLFRAVGNHQGRSRLGGKHGPSAPRPPRALVLATGEKVPAGASIRGRLVVLEVRPGEVNRSILSECQAAGHQGILAESMGAFLSWIAGPYEDVQKRLQVRVLEIRGRSDGPALHARLPGALAELQVGCELFMEFAFATGVIGSAEKQKLDARSRNAFNQLTLSQAPYHHTDDPAVHFLALLRATLAYGRAHVADRVGRAPDRCSLWGWRRKPSGRWASAGTRIGWVIGTDLFLESAASYQVAQEFAGAHPLPGEQTLRHKLRESGLLASVDVGRQMVQVRRTLQGNPRLVLHLKVRDLLRMNASAS